MFESQIKHRLSRTVIFEHFFVEVTTYDVVFVGRCVEAARVYGLNKQDRKMVTDTLCDNSGKLWNRVKTGQYRWKMAC